MWGAVHLQSLRPFWVREGFWGSATTNAGPELFFEQNESRMGGAETGNGETGNEAGSVGVDKFENLLVRESVRLCD